MPKKKEYVAVWLDDTYARDFVGAQPSELPSRWVATGDLHREEGFDGIWLSIDKLEERRTPTACLYTVTPSLCLIRWHGIITIQIIQRGEEAEIRIEP